MKQRVLERARNTVETVLRKHCADTTLEGARGCTPPPPAPPADAVLGCVGGTQPARATITALDDASAERKARAPRMGKLRQPSFQPLRHGETINRVPGAHSPLRRPP